MSSPIQVSPWHTLALSRDYAHMIKTAPREDFVVRTLAKRMSGSMTLMMGELVIAGAKTRELYEGATQYPVHFRKTYYPGKMHGDPAIEYERHLFASTLIQLPPPIGHTPNTYRSCFLPGTPFNRLSELGAEPDESNIALARALPLATLAGLYSLAEEAYGAIVRLREQGLCHADAHLHNFIVCPSPLSIIPIDFERACRKEDMNDAAWETLCARDASYLLKFALFLQSALGHQKGRLAEDSTKALAGLVEPPEAFERAISERSF